MISVWGVDHGYDEIGKAVRFFPLGVGTHAKAAVGRMRTGNKRAASAPPSTMQNLRTVGRQAGAGLRGAATTARTTTMGAGARAFNSPRGQQIRSATAPAVAGVRRAGASRGVQVGGAATGGALVGGGGVAYGAKRKRQPR